MYSSGDAENINIIRIIRIEARKAFMKTPRTVEDFWLSINTQYFICILIGTGVNINLF